MAIAWIVETLKEKKEEMIKKAANGTDTAEQYSVSELNWTGLDWLPLLAHFNGDDEQTIEWRTGDYKEKGQFTQLLQLFFKRLSKK